LPESITRYPIAALISDLAGIPLIDDPVSVKRRSRDFFWYSPVLQPQLQDKFADLVVCPRNEPDVIRIAASCARHQIPITVRGAGTGNYGQAVPLRGGIIMDMTALNAVERQGGGIVRVQPGLKMYELDRQTKPNGFELRMHPSTKRSATIGGFIAGGSGGVGSVTYGGLRERGNICAARIVTAESEPRILELRDDDVQMVNRAYGTTGIITCLEMPLAPAWPWVDLIIAFDDFLDAVRFGSEVALADGIIKKLLSPITWPLPTYFGALRPYCPHGRSVLIVMVAQPSLAALKAMLQRAGGEITYEAESNETPGSTPLYEYTWNHTTLQVLKSDRSVTYLQCLFPYDRLISTLCDLQTRLGDEVLQHLEFIRFGGHVTASALPIVRYTTTQRLDEIIAIHESHGVMVANPHVVTLEDGSRHKRADADQLRFKHDVDPFGLLNPGKMRSFVPAMSNG